MQVTAEVPTMYKNLDLASLQGHRRDAGFFKARDRRGKCEQRSRISRQRLRPAVRCCAPCSLVTGLGFPPSAGTRESPPTMFNAATMTPSSPQFAPTAL